MKAKLTLNGKEYEVELSKEQVSDIEQKNKPKTGFESSGGFGTEYYVSDYLANEKEPIFSDEKLCKDYARAISLFLKLSEWQAKNDDPVCEDSEIWYGIKYDYPFPPFCVKVFECKLPVFGCVKFHTRSKAEEAINVFYNELNWYFTQFKPRLDM